MCGIVGICYRDGRKPNQSLIREMSDMLIHRGPDGEGQVVLPGCAFGHRRLAIIDVDTGAQPMANEDERVWITFNGEIYNYLELHGVLEGKHRFRTRSDTETIVHLYEEIGIEVVKQLRGMFAFGIWDVQSRLLMLARDRVGKKPLFWFEDKEGIYFSSELKALLCLPNCPRAIDYESIELFLAYQSIPGTKTIFRGVQRLAAASYLLWTPKSSAKIEKYWLPDWTKKTQMSYQESKEYLRDLIIDATRCRMISDVPLGAFLSGGVDSSIIVSAMAGISSMPVKTFTIGFPQADFTETKFARRVSGQFGTDHEEFMVEPSATDILPQLVWHYDQPFGDPSALPTFFLSRMAREHVTVALNGDGGDEFFGGYEYYQAVLCHGLYSSLIPESARDFLGKRASRWAEGATKKSILGKIKRFLQASEGTAGQCHLRITQLFNEQERGALYSSDFQAELKGYGADRYWLSFLTPAEGSDEKLDFLDQVLRADTLGFLPDTLLTKVDIASMAVSLEGRSPLLDTSVMEFAASLPSSWKVGLLATKRILKEAYEGILPKEILYRPKMGFNVPLAYWFRDELFGFIRDVLLDKQTLDRGYFNPMGVTQLVADHQGGRRDNSSRLWALMMLELWHRQFCT